MTDRIFKVYGKGTGATSSTVTAALDGQTVYSGTVYTDELPFSTATDNQKFLFEFALPVEQRGTFSATFSVDEGSVFFSTLRSNTGGINNPIYSEADFNIIQTGSPEEWVPIYNAHLDTPLTQEEIDLLASNNVADYAAQIYMLTAKGIDTIILDPDLITDQFGGYPLAQPYYLDSVSQPTRTNLEPGELCLEVQAGSTLRFDIKI